MVSIIKTQGAETGTNWHANQLSNRVFLVNSFCPFVGIVTNISAFILYVRPLSLQIMCTDVGLTLDKMFVYEELIIKLLQCGSSDLKLHMYP